MSDWKNIGTLLLEYGLINTEDLAEGLKVQKESGLRLGNALVKLGKVSAEDIDWVLSKQLDIPYVIIDDINVNIELLQKFDPDFLIENRILPLYEAEDEISIVIEDPFNKTAINIVEQSFSKKVSISSGSANKIEDLLKKTFHKGGLPDLIGSIRNIIKKINETSFYRIDFFLAENSCAICVFGAGILKKLDEIKGHFTNEDIFRALDNLNVHFLYEQSCSSNRRFIAVFPLVNRIAMKKRPAIIGRYGLFLTDDVIFSDAHVYGLAHVFPVEKPIHGYPYLVTRGKETSFEEFIYVIDSAPPEFTNYYIDACIPKRCTSCNGAGCSLCKGLGYEFKKIEGVFSSDDLHKLLNEVRYGKD